MLRTRMFSDRPGTPGRKQHTADYQVNLHAGTRGPVEMIDYIRIDQRIHFHDYAGREPGLRIFDFPLDMIDDEITHADRGNNDLFQVFRRRRPRHVIEYCGRVLAQVGGHT